jgi:glycosyltransferase involved in cell wall biosynthesis
MVNIHIAVLMMVKNEHKRIHVTLDSIKNFANSLVIYDTGSTDNTLDICKEFCEKNNIPLRLKEGEFANFSESRNVSLDFADTFEDIDYLLLLDVNDELRGGDKLRKYAEEYLNSDKTSFLLQQEWWSGTINKYYNSRFLKPRTGWRYTGVVHEYLKKNNTPVDDAQIQKISDNDIVLYQDRTQDDDKTGKRFHRDEILLKEEYRKDPTEPRTVFYLAQTYSCLGNYEDAYYFYKLRTTLIGFYEERFESCLKCGDFAEKLNLDWYESFSWYMKAYELIPRVEPLLRIGEHYQKKDNWILSFTFYDLACKLKYPDNCILFIDRMSYEYKRWHLLSIVAYYAGFMKEGIAACKLAIENGTKNNLNVDLDKKNLEIYMKKEKDDRTRIENETTQINQQNLVNNILTKSQFITSKIQEIKKEFPKLSEKQVYNRAKLMWKNKK